MPQAYVFFVFNIQGTHIKLPEHLHCILPHRDFQTYQRYKLQIETRRSTFQTELETIKKKIKS